MASKKSTARFRNVGTIVYPDSVNTPENWQDILRETHLNFFISPLHDKDINPLDNEPKKPHFHVICMCNSVHPLDFFEDVFSKIGGVGTEIVKELRNYARYLCHLDNPDKVRYHEEDVVSIGTEDYLSVIDLPTSKYIYVGAMIEFCENNGIDYYHELLRYAKDNEPAWFRALCDNCTLVMSSYFKSKDTKQRRTGIND